MAKMGFPVGEFSPPIGFSQIVFNWTTGISYTQTWDGKKWVKEEDFRTPKENELGEISP
jgi:hypothetical protein